MAFLTFPFLHPTDPTMLRRSRTQLLVPLLGAVLKLRARGIGERARRGGVHEQLREDQLA